jgi:Coiled-coil domain-containing protein 55 (DUF2040)
MQRRRGRGLHVARGRQPAAKVAPCERASPASDSDSTADDVDTSTAPVAMIAAAAAASAARAARRIRPTAVAASVAAAAAFKDEDAEQPPDALSTDPAQPETRGSRYIEKLVAQAAVRKDDAEAALERRLARERQDEDGMYADKERFVTGAYKDKLAQREAAGLDEVAAGKGIPSVAQKHDLERGPLNHQAAPTCEVVPGQGRNGRREWPPMRGTDVDEERRHPARLSESTKPVFKLRPLRGLRRNDSAAIEAYRQRYFARRDARAKASAEGRISNSLVPW